MESRELSVVDILFFAIALVMTVHGPSGRVRLPYIKWSTVAEVLACPYMLPPECRDPLPGP
jgi:hypothetical protein